MGSNVTKRYAETCMTNDSDRSRMLLPLKPRFYSHPYHHSVFFYLSNRFVFVVLMMNVCLCIECSTKKSR